MGPWQAFQFGPNPPKLFCWTKRQKYCCAVRTAFIAPHFHAIKIRPVRCFYRQSPLFSIPNIYFPRTTRQEYHAGKAVSVRHTLARWSTLPPAIPHLLGEFDFTTLANFCKLLCLRCVLRVVRLGEKALARLIGLLN